MAYAGTTAATSLANPPRALFAGMWGARSSAQMGSSQIRGQNLWMYNSTHSSTEMAAANFFTDGFYIGMKEGDMIMGTFTTGSSMAAYIAVIGPVTTAGCAVASSGAQIRSQ